MDGITFRNEHGHCAVYRFGIFLFSADTWEEAVHELEADS